MKERIEALIASLRESAADQDTLLGSGVDIWTTGGWAMIALAVVALFIHLVGLGVLVRLSRIGTRRLDPDTVRLWIHEPSERRGRVGAMFDRIDDIVSSGESSDVHDAFDEIRTKESAPFQRDLRLMKVGVGAAPLVGLLGTVTGMLATFGALGSGGGGDQTMAMIAKGIKEALYTTETGLVVALPSLFFHYWLSRRFARFRFFLQRAESIWAQDRLTGSLDEEERRLKRLVSTLTRHELTKRVLAHIEGRRASGAAPDTA